MRKKILLAMCIGAFALPLAACNDPQDTSTAEQTFGPSPTLPAPQNSWIPTINIATATGWPAGGKPTAANGMAVNAFAIGLDHPRTLYVLPNGDVLAAETKTIQTALRKGLHPRVELRDPSQAPRYLEMGVKHFCIGWDVRILADWWDTKGAEMRKLLRAKPKKTTAKPAPAPVMVAKGKKAAKPNGKAAVRGNYA